MAIYTIDEGSMELVVQLPNNFPLGPVIVDSGKKVGVTTSQWRTWMLQLTTFLQVKFIGFLSVREFKAFASSEFFPVIKSNFCKVYISVVDQQVALFSCAT